MHSQKNSIIYFGVGCVQIPIRCSKSVPHVLPSIVPSPRRRARIRDVASGVQAFSYSLEARKPAVQLLPLRRSLAQHPPGSKSKQCASRCSNKGVRHMNIQYLIYLLVLSRSLIMIKDITDFSWISPLIISHVVAFAGTTLGGCSTHLRRSLSWSLPGTYRVDCCRLLTSAPC